MKRTDDRIVLGVIEQSAVVGAVERLATRLGQAASASSVLDAVRSIARGASRERGVTILAAVATHVGLVGAVVRPVSWYWLIIPGIFAAAGAVLAAGSWRHGRGGE